MARGFDLTAEINLRGPSNIRTVVADIRRQLGTIQANVDVQINPATARNLDTLNRNFGDFNRTLTATRTSADATAASLRNLAQAIQNTSGRSNQLPRNLQQINNATQNLTRDNNNAARATRDLTGSFEDFGRQSALAVRRFAAFATVTGVIYKVSSAITSAAKDFIDFDKELVRVAQVTDTSVKNLGSLVNQITQLSTKFGVASKDLIQVSSTLAQAGLSARDTEKALRALALSALAPSFDSLNETVEGSIALMRQFGISAGDLEKALGSVNAVAAKFAVEASDLITAIQRTGGVFATASKGVSEGTDALNEFIAVFTSVRATTRESAETIATGLRTIFTRIQRGSTIEALKEYGVVLTDLEGKFVGPYEAVRRLSAGLNQLDPRDLKFSRIVEELGGFRQIGKVIPLIQQFATAQAALKVAQTGQDSLAKDTTIAQQALARQISKVKEEFIGLIRSIGQSDGFQTVVKLTLDLTSNLIRMADAAKDALPAIAAIMAFRGASALNQYAIGFVGGMRGRPARPQGANNGGYIRGYASGGYVPGTGNSDTVPAMLTPGEFVIRKKAVETIGASNLHRMNRYAYGGPVQKFKDGKRVKKIQTTDTNINNIPYADAISSSQGILSQDRVGVAILNPSATEPNRRFSKSFPISIGPILKETGNKYSNLLSASFGNRNKRSVMTVVEEGLDPSVYQQFSSAIDTGLMSGLNSAIASINIPGTRNPVVDENNKRQFLAGINDAARGNLFEQILDTIASGGLFDRNPDPQRPFDFVTGLGPAGTFFSEAMRNIRYVDAKASEPSPENIAKKIGNQVLRDIGAKAGRGESTARSSAGRQQSGGISQEIMTRVRGILQENPAGLQLSELRQKAGFAIKASDLKGMGIPKFGGTRYKLVANGGAISGEDTVPALLTPGEFVINKKAASRIGASKLHQLNRADKIQGFNRGGAVGNIQKFMAGGGVAPGDSEARIQRMMMLFESFIDNLQNDVYKRNRASGNSAQGSLDNARKVVMREFADASTEVIRNARSLEDAMEKSEASSRVISNYIKRADVSSQQISKSSSFTQKAFQAIQNSTNKIKGFFARPQASAPSADNRNANGGRGGFNLQNFGLSLAFIGPAIGDAIVNALGNDKVQNKGLSSAITGVTSGLAIGSQFGPYGALAGAALGAASALDNFNKGVADAEIELSKLKIDQEADQAEKNIAKLLKQPNNANLNQNILASLRKIGLEEEKNLSNEALKRRPGAISNTLDSYFGENALERITFGFYKNRKLSTSELSEQEASQNTMGSDIARKALTTKIESGLTFDQALSSFGASGQQAIRNNILEADKEYRQKLAELNEQAKTDPKIAINLSERQKLLADKYFLLATEAERALSIDKQRMLASQKLAKTLDIASVSISQTFENMNQALGRAKFEFNQAIQKSDDILNNQASNKISFRAKDILNNPNAYSADERKSAVKQVSGMFGQDKRFVEVFYNFGENVENTIKRISVEAQKTGNNENISEKIVNELTRQMLPVFGDNRLTQSVREQLKDVINAQANDKQNGGAIDPQKLLDIEGFKQIIEYSKASYNTLKNQFETLEEIMNSYGQEVEKASAIQKQVQDNLANLQNGLISTSFRLKEIFGKDVDINDRLRANKLDTATRFGLSPTEADPRSLMMKRQSLIASREEIKAKLEQAQQTENLNVKGIAVLQTRLTDLNTQIRNVDGALESLPGAIEKNINDILGEIQRVNSERENKIQAGTGLAEKLVGSTPDEIRDLNETYSVLNRTLNGNLVTINQSTAAQRAYFETLNRGGSPMEAMSAAQQAFASQTQQALGMFNELAQVNGLKGQEVNNLRADLLENFARAQGLGLQNSPIFRKIIDLLRQPPEEDKQLMKLQALLRREQEALLISTNILNTNLLQTQEKLLANANQGLITALNSLKNTFENAQKNNQINGIDRPGNQMPAQPDAPQAPFPFNRPIAQKSKGGIIYASSGGYLSQGSDTVPAMLSPGEFVVNSKATSKNLSILAAMNDNAYHADGGVIARRMSLNASMADAVRSYKDRALDKKVSGILSGFEAARQNDSNLSLMDYADSVFASDEEKDKLWEINSARESEAIRQRIKDKRLAEQQESDRQLQRSIAEGRADIEKRYADKKAAEEAEQQARQARLAEDRAAYDARIKEKADTFSRTEGLQAFQEHTERAFAEVRANKKAREEEASRIAAESEAKKIEDARQQNYEASRLLLLTEKSKKGKKLTKEEDMELAMAERARGVPFMSQRASVASHTKLQREMERGLAEPERQAYLAGRAERTTKGISEAKASSGIGGSAIIGGLATAGIYSAAGATDATDKEINAQALTGAIAYGGDLVMGEIASVGLNVVGGHLAGVADKIAETRRLRMGQQLANQANTQFIPVQGLEKAAQNLAKKSRMAEIAAESADQMPLNKQIVKILEREPDAAVTPKASKTATAMTSPQPVVKPQVSASATPKATSIVPRPKLGEKFRTPLVEKAGLSPKDVAKMASESADDLPKARGKVYDPTENMGPITTKDKKDLSRTLDFVDKRNKKLAFEASADEAVKKTLGTKAAAKAKRENSFFGKAYKGTKSSIKRGFKLASAGVTGLLGGKELIPYVYDIEKSRQQEQNNRKPIKRKQHGGIIYASYGMMVPYEPKGTDTVPAMLTPGEFVINRQSTQKHLPLLKAINDNRLAKGGTVPPIYAQAGARIGAAGIGVGQEPSAQNKAIMLLAQIAQGINQLNNNLPKEKTNTEPKPKDRLLGSPVDETRRGLRGETPIQQAFREGRNIKEVKEDRKFAAAADRYEKRAAYETQKSMRAQAYEERQIRGRIASGKTKKGDEERFDELQFSIRPTESKQKEISDSSFAGMSKADKEIIKDNNSSYAITRRRQIDERYFPDSAFPKPPTVAGPATVQQGAVATATSQIASPTAGMSNFDQIFGPLTTNVTQFSQALSSATPFLNQIASFAGNGNFQSQQPGVSNNGGNASGNTLSLDGISQFTTKFEAFIGQLKGLNLPPVINVQGNHKVEVVFNGASTLENLATESIASLVRQEVSNAMNKLNRDSEGAIPNAGG